MKCAYRLIALIAILSLFISCMDLKINPLDKMESFTEELEQNSANYTQEDWDVAENQYELICEELDQYDYTDEELRHIGKLKGRCTAIFAKHVVSGVKRDLHRFGQEVEGFFEGVKEGLDDNSQ